MQKTMQKTNSNNPVGIILAGGLSTRMGSDKAQLQRNGITMLAHCRQSLLDAGISNILVSRNKGEGIADVFTNCGPLGGIYSVIATLDDGPVLILPIDMPLLQAIDLRSLIASGETGKQPVCFADCYLPLYLPVNAAVKDYLQQQLSTDGNRSVKGLIKQFNGRQIEAADSRRLVNTNTPQQWQQWQQ